MLSLAIIVPLYNPHNGWFEIVCDSIESLNSIFRDIDYSIVMVNDGSTNIEESYIERLIAKTDKITYLSYPVNKGKGNAIRYGLWNIHADYYVYTDIDFPFGHEVIMNMYQIFKNSSTNLIIGMRNELYFRLLPIKRKILSRALINMNYLLTRFRVHDTQAGLKGLDNEAKKVFLSTKTNGFLADLEFIRSCLRKKLDYTLINIQPKPNLQFSNFRSTVIKREIKNLFKICFLS